jgi:hypothetical protein
MKSPNSMRNGRFHPPKCRDKVQKMGVAIHPFFQIARPIPKYPHNTKINKSINQKIGKKTGGRRSSLQFVRPWAATGR